MTTLPVQTVGQLNATIASLKTELEIREKVRLLEEQRDALMAAALSEAALPDAEVPNSSTDPAQPIDLTVEPMEDVKPVIATDSQSMEHMQEDLEDTVMNQEPENESRAAPPTHPKAKQERVYKARFASVSDDPAYSSVVMSAEGKYVELHCFICKGNIIKGRASLVCGATGLRNHILQTHKEQVNGRFTNEMVMSKCVKCRLSKKEAKAVDEGDHDTYQVTRVVGSKVTAARLKLAGPKKVAGALRTASLGGGQDSEQQDRSDGPRAKNTAPGGPGKRARDEAEK